MELGPAKRWINNQVRENLGCTRAGVGGVNMFLRQLYPRGLIRSLVETSGERTSTYTLTGLAGDLYAEGGRGGCVCCLGVKWRLGESSILNDATVSHPVCIYGFWGEDLFPDTTWGDESPPLHPKPILLPPLPTHPSTFFSYIYVYIFSSNCNPGNTVTTFLTLCRDVFVDVTLGL